MTTAVWMSAVNRTNELDANAVGTQETFTCYKCGKATQFTVWRTPEYTRSGSSNLSHNVKYSDGTHTVVAPTLSVKAPVVLEAAVPVEFVVNAAPAASAAGSVKATGHVAGSPATCTSPQT